MSNLLKSKFLLGVMVVAALALGVAAVAPVNVAEAANCSITVTLRMGMSSSQVKCLQQTLNEKGFTVATSGAGSPGNESMYFGSRTKAAVMAFQTANGLDVDGRHL